MDFADAKLYFITSLTGVEIAEEETRLNAGEAYELNYRVLPDDAIMDRVKIQSS